MDWALSLADPWCPLVVAIKVLMCLDNKYDVSTGDVVEKYALVALIQVAGTWFHIAWEK